jgi:hypothetical protein
LEQADFSTDAGNSALIVKTKSPQRPAVPDFLAWLSDGETKTTAQFSSP